MKVKIFDCDHEKELEDEVNEFIIDKKIVDIKYQLACFYDEREQIYCFSAMIIYE